MKQHYPSMSGVCVCGVCVRVCACVLCMCAQSHIYNYTMTGSHYKSYQPWAANVYMTSEMFTVYYHHCPVQTLPTYYNIQNSITQTTAELTFLFCSSVNS